MCGFVGMSLLLLDQGILSKDSNVDTGDVWFHMQYWSITAGGSSAMTVVQRNKDSYFMTWDI